MSQSFFIFAPGLCTFCIWIAVSLCLSLCVLPCLSLLVTIYISLELYRVYHTYECIRGSQEEFTLKNDVGSCRSRHDGLNRHRQRLATLMTNQYNNWPLWCQGADSKGGPTRSSLHLNNTRH